ncbi:MAG: HD family phosphohydrolase [Candidatus Caldatribacteriaceae bacterium]
MEESGLSEGAVWVLSLLVTRFLRPNAIVDELQTQKARMQILQSLEPVRRVVRRGEILVQKGDIVTREHVQALEALGLVGRERRWSLALVLCILLGRVLILEYLYLRRFVPHFLRDELSLLVRLFTIGEVIALNIFTLRISPFFFVLGALLLVLSALFGREVALGESLLLFPLLLWVWRIGVPGGVLLYLHLIFPLFLFGRRVQRKDFVRLGGVLSLSGAALGALFSLYEGLSWSSTFGIVLYGAAGGITSSVVALGSVSLFESVFHLTTDFRLMELLNPTHPLLKRLMIEAPGTYSHSLVVANLAEVAAEEIGGDVLLARVGAYYHDIGKLKRPYCFIENQVYEERNIHDRLSPYLSALVITSHVRDGVEIAQSFRLPREVQNIIRSHHGQSVVRYFYEKARRLEGDGVKRDAFRYPGPLPRTPEEVIVFLADSAEAAVRSMRDPTPRRVEMTVRNIVRMYLEDRQLDESSLTFRDLNRIASRFVVFLSGMIHARVPYPSLEKKEGVRGKS